MKPLLDFLNEWKQDLMPQCVIVMGGPGAGKTYWMDNSSKRFFQNNITPRKLDSDHNLVKFQREHINELSEKLLFAVSDNAVSDAISKKKAFQAAIQTEQDAMDKAVDYGNKSPMLSISKIEFNFVKNWAERYDNAAENKKEEVLGMYKKAFDKEYFSSLFASDFSVRSQAKIDYKKDFQLKLKGEYEDMDFVSPSDVIVAITGDDLEKIQAIVDVVKDTHNITVVYLNVPAEMSIRQDASRDRSLGKELVLKILGDVQKTWELLTKEFKGMGITKLVEMTTDEKLAHPLWKVNHEYLNIELLKQGLK